MAQHTMQGGLRIGNHGAATMNVVRKYNDAVELEITTDGAKIDRETVTGAAIHLLEWADGSKEWYTFEDVERLIKGKGNSY